jgi:hypothetical protein
MTWRRAPFLRYSEDLIDRILYARVHHALRQGKVHQLPLIRYGRPLPTGSIEHTIEMIMATASPFVLERDMSIAVWFKERDIRRMLKPAIITKTWVTPTSWRSTVDVFDEMR